MTCQTHARAVGRCIRLLLPMLCLTVASTSRAQRAEPLIVGHTCTDITRIPESAIQQAKATLHIAYGHTSHGSQLTDGMTGLVAFANGGGLGLSLPQDIFAWNDGGAGGALDLEDYAMPLDLGYYPEWVDGTRAYLGEPDTLTGRGTVHADVNVVIWAWCGQADNKYVAGTLDAEYLTPMSELEADYPGITFVYMTDHVDHGSDANNKAAGQMIRDFCTTNNKVLYDFADIESYDPDGTFYEYPDDNCDYYDGVPGTLLGNWAIEWQDSHTIDVDWYVCDSAHSQPLNANQKAYAAWWLWSVLGGWDPPTGVGGTQGERPAAQPELRQNRPNPFNPGTEISYRLPRRSNVVIVIYDVRGTQVRTLVDAVEPPGTHIVAWDGRNDRGVAVGSGVYFCRLTSGQFVQTRKLTLLK